MNGILMGRLGRPCGQTYLNYSQIIAQNRQIVSMKILRKLNTISNVFNENHLKSQNKCPNNEWQPMRRTISTLQKTNQLLVNRLNDNLIQQKRYKKGKKGSKREQKDESSDEESGAEEEPIDEFDPDLIDGKAIGFQDINASVVSLRLDNVLKVGLNMARTRVDEAFYANLIRVNGQRVSKKSVELSESDEIDLIRGLNQENQDLLDVSRVVIKKIEDKKSSKDRLRAKLRRFRVLTVENYPTDPYDGYVIHMVKKETEL